jgi:hypothetical protein
VFGAENSLSNISESSRFYQRSSRHDIFVTGKISADFIARVLCPIVKHGTTPYPIRAFCEK